MPRAIACISLLVVLNAGCEADSNVLSQHTGCADCEIVLQRVGFISDRVEPGILPDYMVYVDRDQFGRIVTVSRERDAVLVFDSSGSLLAKLGRAGEGPGEFRAIRRVLLGPGDSIFVSDWGTGRITVYDPALHLARMHSVMYYPSIVLPAGGFVVAEQIHVPERIGYPLHFLTESGELVRSFGVDTPQYRSDMALSGKRFVAPARAGGVWSVGPGRYVIERWDPTTGKREQTITVKSKWFKEISKWPDDERLRPPAVIEGLWEDDNGLIWVVLRDADIDWTPPPPAVANVERPIHADDYQARYDWVVEVVDPLSASVVASKRFREVLWIRPPAAVVLSARTVEAMDVLEYDVWKPILQERGGTQ